MSEQELKPCPFCGQTPEHEVLINQGYDDPQWWIECPNHNCPIAPGLGDSCRETAKERWNTRTPDPMLEELAGALEKSCDSVRELIDNSRGVEGLHLNGDVAPWHDLRSGGRYEGWLVEFDEALDILQKYQQSKVQP